MAKKKPASPSKATAAEALDRREAADRAALAASARRKLSAGESPNRAEARALRQVEAELSERYGDRRIHAFPKGELGRRVGRAPKVLIDLFRRFDVRSWFSARNEVDRDALLAELIDLLIDHGKSLQRSMRAQRLQATGDADPSDLDYDRDDARRMKAVAGLKEIELARELEQWAPVSVLGPLLREVLESDLRAAIDDYDRRDGKVTVTSVAARLRTIVDRIGTKISDALEEDGSRIGSGVS